MGELKKEVQKILSETLDETILSEIKKLQEKVDQLERRFKNLEEKLSKTDYNIAKDLIKSIVVLLLISTALPHVLVLVVYFL